MESGVWSMSDTNSAKKTFDWALDFSVNLGETHSRFFDGLTEETLWGVRCPECDRTFFPPQPHCDECFVATDEWVEMPEAGVIESYAVTYFQFMNMPEPPYVTGVIRVGDSATCLLHFVDEIDHEDPEELRDAMSVGMDVEPVWAADKSGSILDIEYFKPT